MKFLVKYAPKSTPFLLGFLISLIGALPLGYINVISLQLLLEQGSWASFTFILGIITVEYFVLKIVSKIAKWLVEQNQLLLLIDIFTIVFLLTIGLYFYVNIGNSQNFSLSQLDLATYPFALGLLLNILNFIQWPYWSGIYIFLFRTERLKEQSNHQNFFIFGAMNGTLIGMLVFAFTGRYFLLENNIQMENYLNIIFALLFFVLGIGQFGKLILKEKKLIFFKKVIK